MSWEAVTWASKQKLKKSYEQIVLLVLANCADPNGEAFVKWPGRDHWWVYLSERTRLPKSSLFRHLNTLVALDLGERSVQVLADGSRRPTFKLNMEASFDIDLPEDERRYNAVTAKGSMENQSPVGTEHDDGFEAGENDSDISHSQADNSEVAVQSPVGTGNAGSQSPVGTEPFPVLRLQEDSLLVPKDSPLPPSGGLAGPSFDDFRKAWLRPIDRMSLAERAWDHTPTAKRGEAITAVRGYFVFVSQQRKDYAVVSAQTFLREPSGWAQWLPYAPDAAGNAPSIVTGYARGSPEASALVNLHDALGVGSGFRSIFAKDSAPVSYRKPMTDQIRAFAEMPPRDAWVKLDHKGAGAWTRFAPEVSMIPRTRTFRDGDMAPWIFPPSVTGKIYTATGPPAGELTEDDLDAFASESQRWGERC